MTKKKREKRVWHPKGKKNNVVEVCNLDDVENFQDISQQDPSVFAAFSTFAAL